MTQTDPMTTAQVAEVLGCSARTVVRMAEDGRLTPALKLPGETGTYLFNPTEIERYVAEQRAAKAPA